MAKSKSSALKRIKGRGKPVTGAVGYVLVDGKWERRTASVPPIRVVPLDWKPGDPLPEDE